MTSLIKLSTRMKVMNSTCGSSWYFFSLQKQVFRDSFFNQSQPLKHYRFSGNGRLVITYTSNNPIANWHKMSLAEKLRISQITVKKNPDLFLAYLKALPIERFEETSCLLSRTYIKYLLPAIGGGLAQVFSDKDRDLQFLQPLWFNTVFPWLFHAQTGYFTEVVLIEFLEQSKNDKRNLSIFKNFFLLYQQVNASFFFIWKAYREYYFTVGTFIF